MTALQGLFDQDPDFDIAPPKPASTLVCGEISTAAEALRFITAGKATVTLRSKKTGTRFTYRVTASEDGGVLFVALLNGPDNESNYQYFANIKVRNYAYWHGKKARIAEDAPSAKAFRWAWHQLVRGSKPDILEVWHEGCCGRCGRKLTVPESIATGFGPECASKMGF